VEIPTKNKDILIGVIVGSLIVVLLLTVVILIAVGNKNNKGTYNILTILY
jgi:hypothetical protein